MFQHTRINHASDLDPERRALVIATLQTIDRRLHGNLASPFENARSLLEQLAADEMATVKRIGESVQLTILGMTIRSGGSEYAALANWQSLAKDRLAGIRTELRA
jgi:hypothetical protein